MRKIILSTAFFFYIFSHSQSGKVGINTSQPKTTLDIVESNPDSPSTSTGISVPRVSVNPTSGVVPGQLIFNTTLNKFQFWDGTNWSDFREKNFFIDTKNSSNIIVNNLSSEQLIPGTTINFNVSSNSIVNFVGNANFSSIDSAFQPKYILKLTNVLTNNVEIIDLATQLYLVDGVASTVGNLQLLSQKNLALGSYKAEIYAHFSNCCQYNFSFETGGITTPVSLSVVLR